MKRLTEINTKKGGGEAVSISIHLLCLHVIRATDAVLHAVAKNRWDWIPRRLPRRFEHRRIILCQRQLKIPWRAQHCTEHSSHIMSLVYLVKTGPAQKLFIQFTDNSFSYKTRLLLENMQTCVYYSPYSMSMLMCLTQLGTSTFGMYYYFTC